LPRSTPASAAPAWITSTSNQIHRWDYDTPIEETLEALHDVVKVGKARYFSAHDQINNLFNLRRRDHATAAEHRVSRTQTFRVWAEICGAAAMI
jgi:aryl-alcohol dehydrogenase-like predicted oxidoreductase